MSAESGQNPRPRKLAWPLQAMPLARAIALIYGFLIIYTSLSPFDFNFQNGVRGLAWLSAPLPRFIPLFDVVANVLAYIPLGFLLVCAVFPRWRRFVALFIALMSCALLAGAVESMQTWLPTRIPSQIDWWANMLGGFIGALLAVPLGPQWLSGSAIRRQSDVWFGLNWGAATLFILFPWAQIYPQSAWLGMGAWRQWVGGGDWGTFVMNQTLREGLITTSCWLGVGLILSLGMRAKAPQWRLLMALLGASVLVKSLFMGLQFGGEISLAWLTTGAVWGMLIASALLWWVIRRSSSDRLWIGLACLGGMLLLVNFFPDNPYYALTLKAWIQGRLLHFNDLMKWVSFIWLPFAIIWALQNQFKTRFSKGSI
jgi:VanZ family protein